MNPMPISATRQDEIIADTRKWLERAVIGLNLCPFAKSVHVKGQVRYVVSAAQTEEALLDDLERELEFLRAIAAEEVDTTLLITPEILGDFGAFASFLDLVEVVLRTQGLVGVLQVASFHPEYVFADAEPDDIANHTNRAPYPTLHLLREASLARARQGPVYQRKDCPSLWRQRRGRSPGRCQYLPGRCPGCHCSLRSS